MTLTSSATAVAMASPIMVNGNGSRNQTGQNGMSLKQRLKRIERLLDVAAQQLLNNKQAQSNGTTINATNGTVVDACDGSQSHHNGTNNKGEIFTTANSAISAINEIGVDNIDAVTSDPAAFGQRVAHLNGHTSPMAGAINEGDCSSSLPTTAEDIHTLKSLLNCPIFCRVVNVEDSLENLRQQLQLHPSIVPPEFDLDESSGELILTPPVSTPPLDVANSKSLFYESPPMPQQHIQHQKILQQPPQQQSPTTPQSPPRHIQQQQQRPTAAIKPAITQDLAVEPELPEMESFEVTLTKDERCLGITIAGYICEKEELAGIFIKSISLGSPADLNGKIRINDQIYSVDGIPLVNYTNHEAVELLRKTGDTVRLGLMRYLRGNKFKKLQKAHKLTATPPGN